MPVGGERRRRQPARLTMEDPDRPGRGRAHSRMCTPELCTPERSPSRGTRRGGRSAGRCKPAAGGGSGEQLHHHPPQRGDLARLRVELRVAGFELRLELRV